MGHGVFHIIPYGCETWSLAVKERLRVLENMVVRRMLGLKKDKVTVEWRKLHSEQLNDLYCSPNVLLVIKLRRMRWAEHVARMGDRRGIYRVLVGKRV
jgi:hypothetical protein